jgi:hypothetical protein
MSEISKAILIDDTKFEGDFQLSRVRVVFPEDMISAIAKVYVEFVIKVSELYEKDPTDLELPAIPLLYSFLRTLELPPDQLHNAFTAIGDPGGAVNPYMAEVIEDMFEALY